jgi:hypothetical protein
LQRYVKSLPARLRLAKQMAGKGNSIGDREQKHRGRRRNTMGLSGEH